MNMKINLKTLLKRCIKQDKEYVLTHGGFNNNCNITEKEREYLGELAWELQNSNLVITFDDIALTPYNTSYDGGTTLAGIKFNKLEKW